jgi:hypothetical protein
MRVAPLQLDIEFTSDGTPIVRNVENESLHILPKAWAAAVLHTVGREDDARQLVGTPATNILTALAVAPSPLVAEETSELPSPKPIRPYAGVLRPNYVTPSDRHWLEICGRCPPVFTFKDLKAASPLSASGATSRLTRLSRLGLIELVRRGVPADETQPHGGKRYHYQLSDKGAVLLLNSDSDAAVVTSNDTPPLTEAIAALPEAKPAKKHQIVIRRQF